MPDDSNDGKTAFLDGRSPAPARPERPKVVDTMPEVPLEQAVAGRGPSRMAIPLATARVVAAALSGEQPTLSRPHPGDHGDEPLDPGAPKFQRGGARAQAGAAPAEPPAAAQRRENLTPEHPGRYVLRKEFGRGGQSSVWLALDQHVGREVAFKQLLPQNTRAVGGVSQQMVGSMQVRFVREARITGQLEHPNIVPVYEVGRRADGSLYYTQKLVRGRTLTAALKEAKTLRDRLTLLPHFVATCQAIAYAHKRGVIHRDLKPDNVMTGEFGETVVLDWGLARSRGQPDEGDDESNRTQEGDVLGTPSYMSPEQAVGSTKTVDEQSDIWSLGAILYEFLTGRPPFMGRNLMQVLMAVAKDPVPPVRSFEKKAPPELVAIVDAALTRDRKRRTQTVKALLDDVEAWRTGAKVSVYKERPWQSAYRWSRKNRALVSSTLAILLVLAAGTVRVWMENKEARRNLSQAFLEKASAEGRQLRWSRAAAYAAAARVEDDTAEARWRAAHRGPYELAPLLREQLDGPVDALALAPDGKRVAVALGGVGVRLYEAPSGKRLAQLDGFESGVTALAFSNDGALLAVAGASGAQLFDGQGGDAKARLETRGAVAAIAISPDGARLATAEGRAARLYDLAGKLLVHLEGHSASVAQVAFAPDGSQLASADEDGSVRAWSPLPAHPGQRVESRVVRNAGHAALTGLGFAPGGKVVVTGSNDGTVRFYDVESTLQLVRINTPQGPVKALAFSADGPIAVLAQDSSVTLADPAAQALVAQVEGDDASTQVALSLDGTVLASANRDGRLRLWKITAGARILAFEAPKGFLPGTAVAVAPSGKRVAVGDAGGHVVLWDVATGKLAMTFELPQGPVHSLAWSPDGKLLAGACEEERVSLFELATGTRTALEGHSGPVLALAWSPDGKLLASAGSDGSVRLWDAKAGSPRAQLEVSSLPLQAVAFSADGALLAAAGDDKLVHVFDVATRRQKKQLAGAVDGLLAVAFSPHASIIAAAGKDQVIRTWRTATGEPRSIWSGHGGRVWSLGFAPDGETLASASIDGTLRLWDVRTGRQVVKFDRPPDARALAFSKDGRQLASIGLRPALQLIELDDKSTLLPPEEELERQLKKGRLRLEGISLMDDLDALAQRARKK